VNIIPAMKILKVVRFVIAILSMWRTFYWWFLDKRKGVWSCESCKWIHNEDVVKCIQAKLPEIIHNVEDIKNKRRELLKLRRECLQETRL